VVVMGIDPGFAILGYGIVNYSGNSFQLIDYGVITTSASLPLANRLLVLEKGLVELIDKYMPDAVSVEDLFFNNNSKTAIKVGQGRGVALLCAAQNRGEGASVDL
jgi:crossover junction endodeoxyribonuclease RuvC